MADLTEPARRIQAAVGGDFSAFMKERGFARDNDRRTWRKTMGEGQAVLNIQAARGNDWLQTRFTVNLGISLPLLRRLIYDQEAPAAPKEYQCDLRVRLDELRPGLDPWWSLGPMTDARRLGRELTALVEILALPWFEDHSSIATVAQRLDATLSDFAFENLRGPTAIYLALGQQDKAQTAFAQLLQNCNPVALASMKAWGAAKGLIVSA